MSQPERSGLLFWFRQQDRGGRNEIAACRSLRTPRQTIANLVDGGKFIGRFCETGARRGAGGFIDPPG